MRMSRGVVFVVGMVIGIARAHAQTPPPPPTAPPPMPTDLPSTTPPPLPQAPTMPPQPEIPAQAANPWQARPLPPPANQKKEPGRGDFDAGSQVRFPSGPDDNGKYATYNWVALDLKGRYFLLDSITLNGNIPLAIIHPSMGPGGTDPDMIGGVTVRLDAKLPLDKLPFMRPGTELGLTLGGAYMRAGALLLSDKDFPLFTGSFEPGLTVGPIAKVKLSSLVDFAFVPVWVYQSGPTATRAVQIPTQLILRLGSLVQLSADVGIYTGNDYSFGGDSGGRIATGGSLTVKIGPIVAHAGAGFASLLTGGLYPTIGDSLYIDLNVKFAK